MEEQNEYNSPYFDTDAQDSSIVQDASIVQDTQQEQFYTKPIIDKIKELFPDRKTHLDKLVSMYKNIFLETKKMTWEKSQKEVTDEILTTGFSLNIGKILEEQMEQIKKHEEQEKTFNSRISAIPIFIDFAYLFYVQHYDKNAPIHKLPTHILKYKLLTNALRAPIDDLYACFEQCIENSFISDLRIEKPPFYLRTDLSKEELKEKINLIVKPLCKDILTNLLKMYSRENPGTALSIIKSDDIPKIQERADNIAEK
jgi:hypothetical protein